MCAVMWQGKAMAASITSQTHRFLAVKICLKSISEDSLHTQMYLSLPSGRACGCARTYNVQYA